MSAHARRGYFSLAAAIEAQHRDELPTAHQFVRHPLMSASTFREDPLPDRSIKPRSVTLPRVRWLERPDP